MPTSPLKWMWTPIWPFQFAVHTIHKISSSIRQASGIHHPNAQISFKNIFNSYNTDNKQTNFLSVFFITGSLADSKSFTTFATAIKQGAIAQLVEQRTENPCVPGSIPGGTTIDSVISRNPLKFSHFNGFSFMCIAGGKEPVPVEQ